MSELNQISSLLHLIKLNVISFSPTTCERQVLGDATYETKRRQNGDKNLFGPIGTAWAALTPEPNTSLVLVIQTKQMDDFDFKPFYSKYLVIILATKDCPRGGSRVTSG